MDHSAVLKRAAAASVGVLILCVAYTTAYRLTHIHFGSPGWSDIMLWQVAAWSFWVPAAIAVLAITERVPMVLNLRWWWVHASMLTAIAIVHGAWFAGASVGFSPYPVLQSFDAAYIAYISWNFILDAAIYAALVAGSLRASSSLVRFTSDGGRLRAAGWAATGPEGALVDAMPGPVIVYDRNTFRILAVNQAAEILYQREAAEFLRLSIDDLCVSGLPAETAQARLPIWQAEGQHRRADRTIFQVLFTDYAVNFDGRWARMMLVYDVTETRRAQEALAASERKYRSMFEDAVVGIFQSTPEGKLLTLNQSAAEAMGYGSPQEAMMAINDIGVQMWWEPRDRERYLEQLRRDGYVSNYIWKMRRRDGSPLWNSENSRAVFGADGKILYIEGTAKDVTAEFAAREELRESERRAAELELLLANAKLRALKDQLKPHFLFNILNTIAMMIRNAESDKAQRMVTLLGDVFRRLLELEGVELVPLEQELEFIDLYLSLEQLRFEDRMFITRDFDAAALTASVPALILQPVMENAVRHGVARITGRCRVGISVVRDGQEIVVSVVNDTGPPGAGHGSGYGIGVRNVRARLEETYCGRAKFDLVAGDGTMTAVLRLPVGVNA